MCGSVRCPGPCATGTRSSCRSRAGPASAALGQLELEVVRDQAESPGESFAERTREFDRAVSVTGCHERPGSIRGVGSHRAADFPLALVMSKTPVASPGLAARPGIAFGVRRFDEANGPGGPERWPARRRCAVSRSRSVTQDASTPAIVGSTGGQKTSRRVSRVPGSSVLSSAKSSGAAGSWEISQPPGTGGPRSRRPDAMGDRP